MKSKISKTKNSGKLVLVDDELENLTPREILKNACSEAINLTVQQLPVYIRTKVDPFYLPTIVSLLHSKRTGDIVYVDLDSQSDQPSFLRCFYKESSVFNEQIKKSFNGTLVLRNVDKIDMTLQWALRGILSQIERDQLSIKVISTGNSDINYLAERSKFDISLLYKLNGAEIVV